MLPPIIALLLFVAWSLWVFAMGMRRGRQLTQEDLAHQPKIVPAPEPEWPIPVSMADYESWVFTDRENVSITQ